MVNLTQEYFLSNPSSYLCSEMPAVNTIAPPMPNVNRLAGVAPKWKPGVYSKFYLIQIFGHSIFSTLLSPYVWNVLLIRIPLNSKENLADEWLRINRAQPSVHVNDWNKFAMIS